MFNVDFIYPIGSLYFTTNGSFNPNIKFGGKWEQLTEDAYLKFVTAGAGSYDGTSKNHKIPVTSMPNHSHSVRGMNQGQDVCLGNSTWGWNYGVIPMSANSAGDHVAAVGNASWGTTPYYPYYYGVYAWRRIA